MQNSIDRVFQEGYKLMSAGQDRNLAKNLKCRSCGQEFDNLGDMQKHILIEHHQKGDIP